MSTDFMSEEEIKEASVLVEPERKAAQDLLLAQRRVGRERLEKKEKAELLDLLEDAWSFTRRTALDAQVLSIASLRPFFVLSEVELLRQQLAEKDAEIASLKAAAAAAVSVGPMLLVEGLPKAPVAPPEPKPGPPCVECHGSGQRRGRHISTPQENGLVRCQMCQGTGRRR